MALIQCPECGGSVSSESKNCIHCGYPLAAEEPVKENAEETIKETVEKPAPVKGAKLTTCALIFSWLSVLFPVSYLVNFFISDSWLAIPILAGLVFLVPAVICSIIALCKAVSEKKKTGNKRADFNKRRFAFVLSVVLPLAVVLAYFVFRAPITYNRAKEAMENGEYSKAINLLATVDPYKDSQDIIIECRYLKAVDQAVFYNWDAATELLQYFADRDYKAGKKLFVYSWIKSSQEDCIKSAENTLINRLKDPSSYSRIDTYFSSVYFTNGDDGSVHMHLTLEITYMAKNSFNANVKDTYTTTGFYVLEDAYGFTADEIEEIYESSFDQIRYGY